MTIETQLMTAEELARLPDDSFRYELVRGELRKMSPAGEQHGLIVIRFTWRLAQYVETQHLGAVYGAETGFILSTGPDTVRAPDVAFVRQARIDEQPVGEGFRRGAPDLAVEVISPSDSYTEVEEKVIEWLDGGTQMLIIIDPRKRTVFVHRPRQKSVALTEADQLIADPVVPGWTVPVRDLFA